MITQFCKTILKLLLNKYRDGGITKETLKKNVDLKVNYLLAHNKENPDVKALIDEILKECM
ncbi:MAG: hypothetical protein HPY74_08325 [Firmicutes bacterium]|nr:hypothetical protein [Bacillota bacterium]